MVRRYYSRTFVGVMVLVLLTGLIGTINYNTKTSEMKENLEQADFIVTRFDIVGSTPSSLLAEGEAEVTNLLEAVDEPVNVETFTLHLYNNSEDVTSVSIPINNSVFNQGIEFQVEIPVDNDNPSQLTANILTDIMVGDEFILEFTGIIDYNLSGISGKINFENTLEFRLNQPFLELELGNFRLFENPVIIEFGLFNPFSVSMTLSGMIDVITNNTKVGEISLPATEFQSNWTTTSNEVNLLVDSPNLLRLYFDQINEPVTLETDLIMEFSGLSINVSPVLNLETGGLDLDFTIGAINSLNLDYDSGDIMVNLNGSLRAGLPISLNLTQISGEIRTGETFFGQFFWNDNQSTFIGLGQISELDFLIINSSISQMTQFQVNEQLNFTNFYVTIEINNQLFQYQI